MGGCSPGEWWRRAVLDLKYGLLCNQTTMMAGPMSTNEVHIQEELDCTLQLHEISNISDPSHRDHSHDIFIICKEEQYI